MSAARLAVETDRDADRELEELYATHARYLAGVAHRLLGDDAEVDDVVQETFVEAVRALSSLLDRGAVRAWLVTIAVRRVQKLLARRRLRRIFSLRAFEVAAQVSDPRDRQPVDELYDALDRLPADLRVPWVLHRIEEITLPEVARACDVSLATVKRRIAEADVRIRRRLSP